MERTLRLPRVHATTPLPCRNIADDLTLSTYNHAFNLIYCNTIIHCLFVSILIITRYHAACFTVYLPQNLPHLPLLFPPPPPPPLRLRATSCFRFQGLHVLCKMRYTAVQKLYKLTCRHSNGSCGGGGLRNKLK
jgi:hypothetical protein